MYKARKAAGKIGLHALTLIVVLSILFPLYFVFISSLKNMSQIYIMPSRLFDFTPIWDHYKYIFETQHYNTYMISSAIVAFASTAISLILGVSASYSIARFHMRKTFTSVLVAKLLPSISLLLPYYFLFSKLEIIDTYSVLILSHIVLSLPLIVWIISSFIADISKELGEAAIVDGCTRQRCFWGVILPIGLSGLVTCAMLSFLDSWNNFQFTLILSGEKTGTLPVSLQCFTSGAGIRWGRMLVATIAMIVPAIVLTTALQRYVIKGTTTRAVKG